MKLPEKQQIISWYHEMTVIRLMHENRWPKAVAEQWFSDFMKWLYTSSRFEAMYQKTFIMDGLHYLDDVWHAYLLSSKDYFFMCQTLFDTEYIHHDPENPFANNEPISDAILQEQMEGLIADWGLDYVDRVWKYGADVFDISSKKCSTSSNLLPHKFG